MFFRPTLFWAYIFLAIGFVLALVTSRTEATATIDKPPVVCTDNDWFIPRATSLIAQSLADPPEPVVLNATIEITERSPWKKIRIKGSDHWAQVVTFKFHGHFKAADEDAGGTAMTVFLYEPASGQSEVMSEQQVVDELKKEQQGI